MDYGKFLEESSKIKSPLYKDDWEYHGYIDDIKCLHCGENLGLDWESIPSDSFGEYFEFECEECGYSNYVCMDIEFTVKTLMSSYPVYLFRLECRLRQHEHYKEVF